MPLVAQALILRKCATLHAGWRLFVTGLALLAFALQSYVTQTHIHPAAFAASTKAAGFWRITGKALKVRGTAPRDNAPADDDRLKCPLCQAIGYAGHFVTSAAAALLLPSAAVSTVQPAFAFPPPRGSPSHIWLGRGPPHS